jgi:hypothetical protein
MIDKQLPATPKILDRIHRSESLFYRRKKADSRHKVYGRAIRLAYRVAADYGIQHLQVICQEAGDSDYRKLHLTHLITFSRRQLDHFTQRGAWEYDSLQPLLPDPAPTGIDAARLVALHEAAHMLVYDHLGHRPKRHHGKEFKQAYSELLTRYL